MGKAYLHLRWALPWFVTAAAQARAQQASLPPLGNMMAWRWLPVRPVVWAPTWASVIESARSRTMWRPPMVILHSYRCTANLPGTVCTCPSCLV